MLKRAFKGQASCIHKLKHKVHGRPASPATFDSAIRVRVRKCALWRRAFRSRPEYSSIILKQISDHFDVPE